jgi:hypothetical protein
MELLQHAAFGSAFSQGLVFFAASDYSLSNLLPFLAGPRFRRSAPETIDKGFFKRHWHRVGRQFDGSQLRFFRNLLVASFSLGAT